MEVKKLNRLKVVMAEKDLSNIWLSEKLGVSQATVSKWMTNFSQPNIESAIKNFNRCYPYFSAIMPYESPEWEKQYVFYSLLVKKLPKLKIDDYTDGLLDDIDFDKYRLVKE